MGRKSIFKRIIFIAIFSIFAVCAMLFAGCDCSGEPEPTPETESALLLDKKAVQATVYQSFTLKATGEAADNGTVNWKTLDDNVVAVDENGNATALGVGETKIVAYTDDAEAECIVMVSATTQVPIIEATNLIDDTVSMVKDTIFTPNLVLTFDGEELNNVEFVIQSLNDDVVTVENGSLKAVAYGNCQVKVTAKLCGKLVENVSATYEVTVVKDIRFAINQNTVNLYAVNSLQNSNYDTQTQLIVEVYESEVKVNNPALAWKSNDESIVTVSNDGMVNALKCGQTTIEITYGDFVQQIPVTVDYAIAEKDEEVLIGKKDDSQFSPMEIFGIDTAITKVYDITEEQDITKLNPINVKETTEIGERTYLICNATYATKTPVIVADYVISNKTQLLTIVPNLTTEYVVLSNNITSVGRYNDTATPAKNTFSGVFDGRGYSISDLNYVKDQCSLFHAIEGATIRNLGLIDVTLSVNQVGGLAYVSRNSNTVDNVQIVIKSSAKPNDFSGGLVASLHNGALNVSNSIIYYNADDVTNRGSLVGRGNVVPVMENSYVVSNIPLCSAFTRTDGGEANNNAQNNINALTNVLYTDIDIFDQAIEMGLPNFTNYNSYWEFNAFKTPVLKSYTYTSSTIIPMLSATIDGTDYIQKGATTVEIDFSGAVVDQLAFVNVAGVVLTDYDFNAGKITFNGSVLGELACGEYQTIIIDNNGKSYKKNCILADNLISTATQLVSFGKTATTQYGVLINDITEVVDMNKREDSEKINFSGTLNGNGHKITALTVSAGGKNGIFYNLNNATIKNLIITNATVTKDQSAVLAGDIWDGSPVISNVTITANMIPEADGTFQGVMFAQIYSGSPTITGCTVYANLTNQTGYSLQGLLAGRYNSGVATINNCNFFSNGNLVSDFTRANSKKDVTNALADAVTMLGDTSDYAKTGVEDLTVDVSKVEGTINTVIVGGSIVEYTVSGTTLTVVKSNIPSTIPSGLTSVAIVTDSGAYMHKINVVDVIITTAAQLVNFAKTAETECAILANDITDAVVIGARDATENKVFSGILDGRGYKITNFTINAGSNQGLFYRLGNATIKNLAIIGATSNRDQTGFLAGNIWDGQSPVISNVMISGTITPANGGTFQGGLFSQIHNGSPVIENSVIYINVDNTGSQGALIGRYDSGSLTLTNTHIITNGNLVSDFASANAKKEETNAKGDVYATVSGFNQLVSDGEITLTEWQTTQWALMTAN